ncbi:MAG: hypothetical protein QRY71_01305 [Candidatus Rhabdochlamydia sp.]
MKLKKIICFIITLAVIERFCYFQTGSFALGKMRNPYAEAYLADESGVTLQQPLTFLGAGKQFYAFITADQKYVVKFMKWSRKRPLPWLENLSLPFDSLKRDYLSQRKKTADSIMQSTLIALHSLQEETHVKLAKETSSWHLIDKLNIHHTVDKCETFVCVQEKAHPFPEYFLLHPEKREKLLTSFVETVQSQCCKGIINRDPRAYRNFGVIDDKVMIIDIGSFQRADIQGDGLKIAEEVTKELSSLRLWLKQQDPSSLALLDNILLNRLSLLKSSFS